MRCVKLCKTIRNGFCNALPVAVFVSAVLFITIFGVTANAAPVGVFPDKYAAIVIDANNGRTLFADKADIRRYPASLTKMMTLYLLFEAVKAKRVSPLALIPISAYAGSQPPTKLNLAAGDRIGLEAAIKALITKSANDVAVAVAEYLGGSERNFVRMMNLKARQLGMRHTNFMNSSGLPHAHNYSTARDLATLSLALQRHFPEHYGLFKTTSFVYRGHFIRGHNRLVAAMAGVDGIKTGYTQMSGFNLASSRSIGNKKIIAVVLGGKTSAMRDSFMAGLLTRYMDKATNKKSAVPAPPSENNALLMAAAEREGKAAVNESGFSSQMVASVPVPTAKILAQLADSASESASVRAAPLAKIDSMAVLAGMQAPTERGMSDRERDSALLMMLASQSIDELPSLSAQNVEKQAENLPAAVPLPVQKRGQLLDTVVTASLPEVEAKKITASQWVVQIAATTNPQTAAHILRKAQADMRKIYTPAKPYTEKFTKSRQNYYRVRFKNFPSRETAQASCARLKRIGYKCLPLQP